MNTNTNTIKPSGACPTYFRGNILAARNGGSSSYGSAGYHLAIHVRDEVDTEEAIAELDAILAARDAASMAKYGRPAAYLDPDVAAEMPHAIEVVGWMERHLPRCMALVPNVRRRSAFALGVARALSENRV